MVPKMRLEQVNLARLMAIVGLLLCGTAYAQAPIVQLPLDGDGLDVSGNGFHATLEGTSPTFDRFGRVGAALFFNGTSDFGWIPSHPMLDLDSVRTVSVWLRKQGEAGAGVNYGVVSKYQNDTPSLDGWMILAPTLNGQTQISARVKDPSVPTMASDATAGLPTGEWQHAVWRFDPASHEVSLFLNGEFAASATTPSLTGFGNPHDVLLGAAFLNTGSVGGRSLWHGDLDDLRIYDELLTEQAIEDLFLEGSCTYAPSEPFVARKRRGHGGAATRFEWSSCGGAGVLRIEKSRATQLVVRLNGERLIGPWDTSPHEQVLSVPVELLAGDNALLVRVLGRRGARAVLEFVGN